MPVLRRSPWVLSSSHSLRPMTQRDLILNDVDSSPGTSSAACDPPELYKDFSMTALTSLLQSDNNTSSSVTKSANLPHIHEPTTNHTLTFKAKTQSTSDNKPALESCGEDAGLDRRSTSRRTSGSFSTIGRTTCSSSTIRRTTCSSGMIGMPICTPRRTICSSSMISGTVS